MSEITNNHIIGIVSASMVPQAYTEISYNVLFPGRDEWKRSDSFISPSDLALLAPSQNWQQQGELLVLIQELKSY